MLKGSMIDRILKLSLVITLALLINACKQKDAVFEITDLTKEQRFNYVTQTWRSPVYKEITITGKIDGCAEVAYFYLVPYNFNIEDRSEWPKHTIMINDSISFKFQAEEGDGVKHRFVFLPGDATKGKITIRIRTL
jgi:hypothetical protein